MTVRAAGLIQIVLGIIVWTGRADALTAVHILIGLILVLALWVLAVAGGLSGVSWGLAGAALVWGIITVVFGLSQTHIDNGNTHWIIQVAHLLVGIIAIGLGEMIGARLRRTSVVAV
jgi:hypothetical protein